MEKKKKLSSSVLLGGVHKRRTHIFGDFCPPSPLVYKVHFRRTPPRKTYTFDWPPPHSKNRKFYFCVFARAIAIFFLYFFVIFVHFFMKEKNLMCARLQKCVRTQFEKNPSPLYTFRTLLANSPSPLACVRLLWMPPIVSFFIMK